MSASARACSTTSSTNSCSSAAAAWSCSSSTPTATRRSATAARASACTPIDLSDGASATSVSVDRHWQGLRFIYGGSKQKVLPQLSERELASSFFAEAVITPAIKEVALASKKQVRLHGMADGGPAVSAASRAPAGTCCVRTKASRSASSSRTSKNEDGGAAARRPRDAVPVPAERADRSREVRHRSVHRRRRHGRRVRRRKSELHHRTAPAVHARARCCSMIRAARRKLLEQLAQLRHRLEARRCSPT